MFLHLSKQHTIWKVRRALLMGLAFGAAGLFSSQAANAAQVPFSMSMNESLAHEGNGIYGDPGFDAYNDVFPPELPERIRIDGMIDGKQISAPSSGFQAEVGSMTIRPMESFFIVKWEASGPITGSYDASDGAAVMNVNLTQTIEQNGSSCSVGPVPVTLSTESTGAVISGSRFEDGLEGPGALVGSWTSVPEPGGPNCDLRKLGCRPRHSLLKGDGAFGMARDRDLRRAITDRPDMTIDKFGIDGYEDEGGCWGKRPDPEPQEPQLKIELSRLSISKSAAKFAARVTNRGGVSTDTELCAYATHGLRFTNPGCLPLGSLANGASVQRRLKVTIPKGKKARARALRRGRIKVRYVEAGIPGLTIHRKITSAR